MLSNYVTDICIEVGSTLWWFTNGVFRNLLNVIVSSKLIARYDSEIASPSYPYVTIMSSCLQ